MKAVLATVLCLCAFGSNLRAEQASGTVPGMAAMAQMSQQFLDSITNLTAGFLLQQMYPDNFQQVQAELNTCIDTAVQNSLNATQSALTDSFNVMNACMAADPGAVVTQLIQDTLNSMTYLIAPQCTFSVNLMGDLNNFLATATAQGFNFMGPMTSFFTMMNQFMAPGMNQMTASMAQSMQPYLTAMNSMTESWEESMGVTPADADKLTADLNTLMTDTTTLTNDFLTTGNVTSADVLATLNDSATVMADAMTQMNEIVASMEAYLVQGTDQMCSLFNSFNTMMPNFASFMPPTSS